MRQLHPIQLQILEKLLFSKSLRFAKIKPSQDLENNQFVYHLKELLQEKYIEKSADQYFLTALGKEYAGRISTETTTVAKQGKISVRFCSTRVLKGKKQFLLCTRLKQPFYGCQQLPSGKVEYGEKIVDCASRELKEETGLTGRAKIVALKHFITFDKNTHNLVTDNYLYLCVIRSPKGTLQSLNDEGQYEWVNKDNLDQYFTNPLENLDVYKKTLDKADRFNGKVAIEEVDFYTEKF